MFIVKLGGSVITDKNKKYCFRQTVMDTLAQEIKKANKKLIIVHGGGSFGHILAKEYHLNEGYTTDNQLQGFAATHAKVQELNTLVLTSLHVQGIPAVSLSPHSILRLDNHKLSKFDYTIFDTYLAKGFTPVTFGDVSLDTTLGFSICSGDLLVQKLAEYFKPEKIVFVIDEDGLYTANPKTDTTAKLIESAAAQELDHLLTTSNRYADVTEGMKGKINTIKMIARCGVDTVLVNGNKSGRLYNVLVGKTTTCTLVHGGKR
jgi:isopentenyl phosphate kinase